MSASSQPNPTIPVDKERLAGQLHKWQERLLDLTKANPLLGINRSRVSKLKIIRPAASELFAKLVLDESELKMPLVIRESVASSESATPPEDELSSTTLRVDPGDVECAASPVELMRRLRRIYDNARTTVEERGVTTLYATFGALVWRDEMLGESVSPLWMIPCQLTAKGPNAPLRLSVADEEMQLNPALELYLRERHKIALPDIDGDPDGESLQRFLERTTEAVREHRWSVTAESWLSTFSFESLVIYNDLKVMAEEACTNSIVVALAQASPLPEGSEALGDDLDASETPVRVPLPVLPADSSQLEAMTYATLGRSVVVHGPPGTGKSQTISNLIADALGNNKTVLFVSAKMAALNVVYQRLAERGLGQFCLEAHSTKAGKTKIIDELRRTLEIDEGGNAGDFTRELEELLRVRRDLNGYVREMHQRREPLGRSVYQAIGLVAKLEDAVTIRAPLPWENPLAVTPAELNECLDALSELGAYADVFDGSAAHPWRGFVPVKGDLPEQEAVESDLRQIAKGFRQLTVKLDGLSALIPDNQQLTLAELVLFGRALAALTTIDRLPAGWTQMMVQALERRATLFDTAVNLKLELDKTVAEFRAAFDVPLNEARVLLNQVQQYGSWFQKMSRSYWRWRNQLRQRAKHGASLNYQSLVHYCRITCRIVEIQEWFEHSEAELSTESADIHDQSDLRTAAERLPSVPTSLRHLQ